MIKAIFLPALLCGLLCAQRPEVTIGDDSPGLGVTILPFYDGGGNQIYECRANSIQPPFTFSIAFALLTNITVAANVATVTTTTAHGLQVGNQVVVTGSATSAVNGTFIIATVPSTTTFTYSDTVASATYTDAALVITTTAPRSSAAQWSIRKRTFSGSNMTLSQWANGNTGKYICDNRAVLSYQ